MRLLSIILITLLAGTANAADFVCHVDAGAPLTRLAALCAAYRIELGNPATWSNDICCTRFAELGLKTFYKQQQRKLAMKSAAQQQHDAILQIEAEFPDPTPQVNPGPTPTTSPTPEPTPAP